MQDSALLDAAQPFTLTAVYAIDVNSVDYQVTTWSQDSEERCLRNMIADLCWPLEPVIEYPNFHGIPYDDLTVEQLKDYLDVNCHEAIQIIKIFVGKPEEYAYRDA